MSESQSPSVSRSKRQKVDKTGRLSALEKLKQLKGSKHKYEIDELENVYEEVDEKEYSKTVIERQSDDWIVDDGNSGYVEDGREIFDDDLDDESIQEARKNKLAGPKKSKKDEKKKKGNIQNMIMNMPSKKKVDIALDHDNILGDLMSELKKNDTPKRSETRTVKNKFCVSTQSNDIKTCPKQNLQPVSECTKIQSNNDSDDDLMMFDKPTQKKTNAHKQTESTGQLQSVISNQSSSQTIIDDDESIDNSSNTVSDIKSKENIKDPSASQIIETESEDLSQFMGDFSNTDFEDKHTNHTEKSVPPIIQQKEKCKLPAQIKNKDIEAEMSDSESFNKILDSDFEMQISNIEVSAEVSDTTELPLPLVTNSDKEEVFRFYYWDACEDPFKQPGIVYLFGKVFVPSIKEYRSCCVTVKNVPRRIYLLPRLYIKTSSEENGQEPQLNTIEDVYKEFNQFANKVGIKEFRCSKVTKYYAFEQEGTPAKSEYLEVRYSANCPAMPFDYSGPSIERVFGTTVNALELLLIERNIKGPCWLDIKCPLPTGVQTSWCKIKVNCMKIENISVFSESQALPPLVVMTLNIQTALNSKQQNEVVVVAILIHHKYHIDKEPPKPPFQQHICLITHPREVPWPRQAREMLSNISYTKVMKFETETDLLEELLKIINTADPDCLIGYDCGFQFDVLMHKMTTLKVSNWSRLGRLRRSTPPLMKGRIILNQVFAGRPTCDIQVSAKELNLKLRSYDLQSLCVSVLKKKENECKEIKPSECISFYNTTDKIDNLIKITLTEALYILSIVFELNVLPLALQITCIAGNVISRTLTAGRAERNEYLLLHAFHSKQYITPDKRNMKKGKNDEEQSGRKKAAYTGGLVLEPKKGFYDKLILLMDFNSLYPSIIQEYNLCFTTVPGAAYADSEDLSLPESHLKPGVIPTEIRKLVESRGEVKKLMKTPNISPELKMQYNIRQLALKLTANSMYGCLGASHCRFYAKGLAALVTAKGREILQHTKSLVEKLNYEVIYGDTDSIMICTNVLDYDEVFSVGKKIKQEVNKLYKRVELDIDGVFRYLLLLQKKKYAAVTMTKLPNGQIELTQELKGLDIVRRDWCQLACDVGKKILDQLLSDGSDEDRIEQIFSLLQDVAASVRENQVSLSSLVITKQLSKNPNDYPDAKQAHVQVALRLNKEGGRMWKAGDTVPYIICDDGTEKSATERAYHIDEYKKSDSLKIDVNYYLLSQVFPICLRICEPIQGIDDVLLAAHLGLENVYKSKRRIHDDENEIPLLLNEERFRYCLPLKFNCRDENCQSEIIIKEVVTETPTGNQLSLASCSNPSCTLQPWTYHNVIQNAMTLAVREAITEYYDGWLECESPICGEQTQILPLGYKKHPTCRECKDGRLHKMFSDTRLYNQLCFYLHLVDVSQSKYKNLLSQHPQGMREAYDSLKEAMEKMLRRNAFSVVCLDTLFSSPSLQQNASILDKGTSELDISDGSDVSDDEM
ncbi:DNA polymerase alpha catalytic subunit [Megachile rotundata]|uniref:DNA polymerase alpha catalytic subunit n=1 Tax=Megachile rotundata TaxID=143995 RepID=UPI000614AB67|nr:PREDICTED: DNA polymerase alpha catalytic subunit isoform X2 [Megachile rotundata]